MVSLATLCPQTVAEPEEGARKPVTIFMVVLLPAPLGPRNPSTSPLFTVMLRRSTATMGPNALLRSLVSITC